MSLFISAFWHKASDCKNTPTLRILTVNVEVTFLSYASWHCPEMCRIDSSKIVGTEQGVLREDYTSGKAGCKKLHNSECLKETGFTNMSADFFLTTGMQAVYFSGSNWGHVEVTVCSDLSPLFPATWIVNMFPWTRFNCVKSGWFTVWNMSSFLEKARNEALEGHLGNNQPFFRPLFILKCWIHKCMNSKSQPPWLSVAAKQLPVALLCLFLREADGLSATT